MKLYEKVLDILNGCEGFVSGEAIADSLQVSRTAVWKSIMKLKSLGYSIDSSTNKGYRLVSGKNLTEAGIRKYLHSSEIDFDIRHSVTSTNTVLKREAESGRKEGYVVVADTQSTGRGRAEREFYSPEDTGVYLSILLRPQVPVESALYITAAAAVAVAEAVEVLTGERVGIKWVNDIFINDKKVCGILTEASVDMECGKLNYAILGIGVNVFEPKGGFGQLKEIAGALFPYSENSADRKCQAAAYVIDNFMKYYCCLQEKFFFDEYKKRLFILGREIYVIRENTVRSAVAVDMDESFRLLVKYENGEMEYISSGEVSTKTK